MVKKKDVPLDDVSVDDEDITGGDATSVDHLDSLLELEQKKLDSEFMSNYADVCIDDLITLGYVSHEVEVCSGLNVVIRTLKKKEELEVKRKIGESDGAQIYVLDKTNVNTLVRSIVSINGNELPADEEKRVSVVEELSDVVAVDLIGEFRDLNKALIILMKGSSKNYLARRLLGQE